MGLKAHQKFLKGVLLMKKAMWFFLLVMMTSFLGLEAMASETVPAKFVTGIVFSDLNGNDILDPGEAGITHVSVSNGKEVAQTDNEGRYRLPAYDEMVIFVSKPANYDYPLNENNLPKFSYIHEPQGSPTSIQKYRGLSPTGILPEQLNFPLIKSKTAPDFKAIITGDTQVYNDTEIGYLRDTLVKEAAGTKAAFVLTVGDNVGDDLSLYPRYLSVMKGINKPVYLTPGNHDVNLDTPDYAHSLDTYKREFGPTYYSFNYGKVHFVVLDTVYYPSETYAHSYHGEIDPTQMEWLKNDLSFVPVDNLIVLSMHIPIVSFVDRLHEQHHVKNRSKLYDVLKGRKVVALAGHTHTTEQFLPGEMEEGWGSPIAVREMIIGAACGSWWSGDTDEIGVPFSFEKCGSPKNYMIFNFNGADYQENFKAMGKTPTTQMNLSFWTPSFEKWFNAQVNWYNADPKSRSAAPPFTQSDLPDLGAIKRAELSASKLVANVWDGNSACKVTCQFDQGKSVTAVQSMDTGDPAALRDQLSTTRYAIGFKIYNNPIEPDAPQPLPGLFAISSPHIWVCPLPSELKPGLHMVRVTIEDPVSKHSYRELKQFEVLGQ
jgi:hypothetical protein